MYNRGIFFGGGDLSNSPFQRLTEIILSRIYRPAFNVISTEGGKFLS